MLNALAQWSSHDVVAAAAVVVVAAAVAAALIGPRVCFVCQLFLFFGGC